MPNLRANHRQHLQTLPQSRGLFDEFELRGWVRTTKVRRRLPGATTAIDVKEPRLGSR